MGRELLVAMRGVNHHFGAGTLRKQVLFGIDVEVHAGEIVILTGHSGSGKTTLLSLLGGLRAAQDGSVRVLDQELRNATEATLVRVRRRIGYIFQFHNLVGALTACQNVLTGIGGDAGLEPAAALARALTMLEGVGLAGHADRYPDQLSGGEKQRVAIARALAGHPRLILADEPTASLDREAGRDVVERIRTLAREEGCAVVLVTHDHRILDIADRLLHLEEGRLTSATEAVLASTQHLLNTLTKSASLENLLGDVEGMAPMQFSRVLGQVTTEAQQLLQILSLATDEAFERMLESLIHAFTSKAGQMVDAEQASLLLGDEERGELWSKVAQSGGAKPLGIRIPLGAGIAGQVYRTGQPQNLEDSYERSQFDLEPGRRMGERTNGMLCLPILDRLKRPFAVLMLMKKRGGLPFGERDERVAGELVASLGVVLETWNEAHRLHQPAH
jgi:putative ABC transport system ATP-binding protein